jgi:hypothetical protein
VTKVPKKNKKNKKIVLSFYLAYAILLYFIFYCNFHHYKLSIAKLYDKTI